MNIQLYKNITGSIQRAILPLMLLVASLVQAQSVEEIKRSRDYYWGEGEGTTIDEADQQALHQMSRSICTKVINITAHSASQTGYILEDLQKTISNTLYIPFANWVL